jgi:serine/threonine-protein kinase
MERIGRYQVERELGRGTMSIVYKAFDPRIDRYLAVKVLREKFARDVTSRKRFLREARSAGGLGHPNIVTVFDVGQIDGLPFMAMELLEGDTLDDRLAEPGALSVEEVLEIAIQLSSALSYAHERGVIHRDVKPANIYFDAGTGMAKLLDFGIAGVSSQDSSASGERGLIAGTPAYMAPEQISGEGQDARCDLYSLGVVLYRLLAGRLPFDEANLSEQMARVVRDPPPPLEPIHAATPVELIELTHRLLAKKPAARYNSAEDVLDELQDIRASMNRGLLSSARQQSAFWRWPLAVATLVAVVLVLGLSHVYRSQNAAMASATFGFGEGLASVVAREIAEPLLLEDSTALGNLVSDFGSNSQVLYLHITDRSDTIQSSTNLFLQDEAVPVLPNAVVRRDETSIRVLQAEDGNLEFQVPIRFQARRIGEVYLGLDGSELSAAARGTLSLMVFVFLIAMLVILVSIAILVRHQRRLIERVSWGLRRMGQGQFDFRLEGHRRDEFGHLYRRFNDMAMRLEERYGVRHSVKAEAIPRISSALEKGGTLDVMSQTTLLAREDSPDPQQERPTSSGPDESAQQSSEDREDSSGKITRLPRGRS